LPQIKAVFLYAFSPDFKATDVSSKRSRVRNPGFGRTNTKKAAGLFPICECRHHPFMTETSGTCN